MSKIYKNRGLMIYLELVPGGEAGAGRGEELAGSWTVLWYPCFPVVRLGSSMIYTWLEVVEWNGACEPVSHYI